MTPAWLTGITRKRPETLLLLQAMVIHGLRHGKVTAESAHHIPVTSPNCRGAATKYLRRMGFTMNPAPIKGTTKQSHGHWLHEWVLVDAGKARGLLDTITGIVCKAEPDGQLVLI